MIAAVAGDNVGAGGAVIFTVALPEREVSNELAEVISTKFKVAAELIAPVETVNNPLLPKVAATVEPELML